MAREDEEWSLGFEVGVPEGIEEGDERVLAVAEYGENGSTEARSLARIIPIRVPGDLRVGYVQSYDMKAILEVLSKIES